MMFFQIAAAYAPVFANLIIAVIRQDKVGDEIISALHELKTVFRGSAIIGTFPMPI